MLKVDRLFVFQGTTTGHRLIAGQHEIDFAIPMLTWIHKCMQGGWSIGIGQSTR